MTKRTRAGWLESVDLPDLDVHGVVAKLDTGARSSCIDARDVDILDGPGHGTVRFRIPVGPDEGRMQELPIMDWRWVRDSGGHAELRPVIHTTLVLDGKEWEDEMTLHERSSMTHRILLGRRVMRRRFLVDPGRTYVLTERPVDSDPMDDEAADGMMEEESQDED